MSAWYRTGTIASAGDVVTGTGTKWADNKMGIGAGQMLIVPGDGIVQMYEILRIDSDTKLRLVNAPSAELSGAYAIVSFYTDSVPDFSRKLTAQLAYYQSQMDGWQQILTGTGQITIIAPDGTAVTMTALGDILQNIDWLQDNKDEIEAAGGYATEAKEARDGAVTAAGSAESSKDSAAASAGTATNAAASALESARESKVSEGVATEKAAAASSDADRAEAAADSIDPSLLMPKSGGAFTGPIELFNDAIKPMEAVTNQQLSGFMPRTGGYFTGEISAGGNIKAVSGDLYSGGARVTHDGNIFGTVWGDSLFAYINRMRNTASLGESGWHRDAATGTIRQWGRTPAFGAGSGFLINFPIPFPTKIVSVSGMLIRPGNTSTGSAEVIYIGEPSSLTSVRMYHGGSETYPTLWEVEGY